MKTHFVHHRKHSALPLEKSGKADYENNGYCENYTKYITKLCGQKGGCLEVKLDGKSS